MMQEILVKTGIPSYVTNIISPIPLSNQLQIPIAKTIPQQIGYIYGLTILTDTSDPQNNNLITLTQAQLLYLVLKDGPTEFFQQIRLDQMVFTPAGFPNLNPNNYMPVNIPGNFDLSTSYYQNPTGVVSVPDNPTTTIMLQLWFISTESYEWLMKKNYIDATYAQEFIRSKR